MPRRVLLAFDTPADRHQARLVRDSLAGSGWAAACLPDAAGAAAPALLEAAIRPCSALCVLTGAETALRPWIRRAALAAFVAQKVVLEITLEGPAGPSVLARLGYRATGSPYGVYEFREEYVERDAAGDWVPHPDIAPVEMGEYIQNRPAPGVQPLDGRCPRHRWAEDGPQQIAAWLQAAEAARPPWARDPDEIT